jgi:hypothetical protein
MDSPNDRPPIVDVFSLLRRLPCTPLQGEIEPDLIVVDVPDDGRPRIFGQWLLTELFCPHCGKQPVHVESGEGDEDVGATYWCPSCQTRFYLP